jgi:hypothetical protein
LNFDSYFLQTDRAMPMAKCLVMIVATLSLCGCCVSGNGCSPALPDNQISQISWDGLGKPPAQTSGEQPSPGRAPRTSREKTLASDAQKKPADAGNDVTGSTQSKTQPKAFSNEWWAQERADQERLTKSISICRNC